MAQAKYTTGKSKQIHSFGVECWFDSTVVRYYLLKLLWKEESDKLLNYAINYFRKKALLSYLTGF